MLIWVNSPFPMASTISYAWLCKKLPYNHLWRHYACKISLSDSVSAINQTVGWFIAYVYTQLTVYNGSELFAFIFITSYSLKFCSLRFCQTFFVTESFNYYSRGHLFLNQWCLMHHEVQISWGSFVLFCC